MQSKVDAQKSQMKNPNQSGQFNQSKMNTSQQQQTSQKKPVKTYTQERNKKQEKSSEELIMEKKLNSVEETCLLKVFYLLCKGGTHTQEDGELNTSQNKDEKQQDKQSQKQTFTAKDLAQVLNEFEYPASKAEIDQMIWEIDENLDGHITREEFELMYKRCRLDTTELEPRSLYNVVQFLMFLQNNTAADKSKKKITVEDTLELLYVRYGRNELDKEIEEIFGSDEKSEDGQEKEISLTEYLEKIKKKDFKKRKELEDKRKIVKAPDKDDEDN